MLPGKVWAFLKYHHPEIGRGDVNWDYSLMRVLPFVLEASTVSARQARVFGSPSAGADGNIVGVTLPGGVRTIFTGIGIYNPDGSETQRVGILPDVEVRPTVAGLQAGRDEVLEAALEWLSTE